MDSSSSDGRTYDEREIARLIERASEIQARAEGATERSLSLAEVGQIAADLGLSVRSLQEAALELEDEPEDRRLSLTGAAPTSLSRVADAVLTAEDWDNVLLELQRFSGSTGKSSEVGAARIWRHSLGDGLGGTEFKTTQVTVRSADDHTTIRVREDYGGAVLAYGMTFFFASFISLMVAHSIPDVSKLAELAIAGSGGLASLGVARALIAASVSRQKKKLSGLADRLAQMVGRGGTAAAASEVESEIVVAPIVSVDEDEEQAPTRTHDRTRTRS